MTNRDDDPTVGPDPDDEGPTRTDAGRDDDPDRTRLAPGEDLAPQADGSQRDSIGRYKILHKLGEGGMGQVFLAEQLEPVRRQVALKVIKLGMDTREVVARFEAERQALAVMDHPHIARVYDGGATENGRPYFAMELVQGSPITSYCDEHKLTTRRRLELFVQVCRAVQHAHQKGVIHRDLKPSNILVHTQEDKPLPKVIDFGIAKATGQSLTDKTQFTAVGHIVGTPAYMSPEQADVSNTDIDTRSDIYALGVILYELLTGAMPFDRETLNGVNFLELQRLIREVDPPRPSTRISQTTHRERLATERGTDLRGLQRQLRGDLDWIVMKALEKDRARRYETANALAQDIEHFLHHEPVTARPPSAGYRTLKFIRRHRAGVITATALGAALVAGVIGTGVGLVRAREEATKVQAVLRYLTSALAQADPNRAQGKEITVRDALDQASEKITESFEGQPALEAEVRETLGRLYHEMGHFENAEPHFRRALELYRDKGGSEVEKAILMRFLLARTLAETGRYDEARAEFEALLPDYRERLGQEHPDTLVLEQNLTAIMLFQKQYDQAEPLLLELAAKRRKILGAEDPQTLATINNLAQLYMEVEEFSKAGPLLTETLEVRRSTLGDLHPRTLISVYNLGDCFARQQRYHEAEPLVREAMDGFREVLDADHPYTLVATGGLAEILFRQQRIDEAEPLALESYRLRRERHGEEHPDTREAAELLVTLYDSTGRSELADPYR